MKINEVCKIAKMAFAKCAAFHPYISFNKTDIDATQLV
jgi:hypothetical protein